METTSPRDQWAHELEHLWIAEQEMRNAIPGDGAGPDEELRQVLKDHQARTEEHLERLREIFMAGTHADGTRRSAHRAEKPLRRSKRRNRNELPAGA